MRLRTDGWTRIWAAVLACVVMTVGAPSAHAETPPAVRWSHFARLIDHRAPFASQTALQTVACIPDGDCLAAGQRGTVVDLTTGHSVSGVRGGASLTGLACPSSSLCVALSRGGVAVSTDPTAAASSWRSTVLNGQWGRYDGITCASARLCVAWTGGDIEVSSDPAGGARSWHAQELLGGYISAVTCVADTTVCVASELMGQSTVEFAVSDDPIAGAASWATTLASGVASLTDLDCPSVSLCVGIGADGRLETSTDPQLGASSWSAQPFAPDSNLGDEGFAGIACADAEECVALSPNGVVAQSADPGGGAATYQLAAATVRTSVVGTTAVEGLVCPRVSLCVGVDAGGGIISSRHPTMQLTPWRRVVQPSATGGLFALSCPTATFCAALGDDRVEVSDSPAASDVWRSVALPSTAPENPYGSISCPSTALCVIAGGNRSGVFVSTDPDAVRPAWRDVRLHRSRLGSWGAVSCPTVHLCVAGEDGRQRIAVTTHPAGGPSAWHQMTLAASETGELTGIISLSCPSSHLCVAVDTSGDLLWSTAPERGSRSWRLTTLGSGVLTAVTCRSAHLCVALGSRASAFSSSNPGAGSQTWRRSPLSLGGSRIVAGAFRLPTAVTCAPQGFSLTGTTSGVALTGLTGAPPRSPHLGASATR